MKAHKTVDVENAKHLANQLAKQVVVLRINLVKTQKNNYEKVPPITTAFFYARRISGYGTPV